MNGDQRYLSPALLQIVGLLLLVGSFVFWAMTGRESILMVSSAITLIGTGAYRGALKKLEKTEQRIQQKADQASDKVEPS